MKSSDSSSLMWRALTKLRIGVSLLVCLICLSSAFTPAFSAGVAEDQSRENLELRFYRLTGPWDVFKSKIKSMGFGFLRGPPPVESGLVPALGTVNRTEESPGQFDNYGLIYLYLKGDVSQTGQGVGFLVRTYAPDLKWQIVYGLETDDQGKFDGTWPIMIFQSEGEPSGVWTLGAQTDESPPRFLFNASFTVGNYFADISVAGLPTGMKSSIDLDGTHIGDVDAKTSIGLGWLPEHTLSTQDVGANETSRYHASPSELKVSGPGEYDFVYALQHYLKIESPYPIDGSGWYTQGEVVPITAPSEVGVVKDSRSVFRRWTGDYSGGDPKISVVMDEPKRVVAEYVTQYLLTVNSPLGSPQGSGWYDEGSSATFSVASPVSVEGLMGMLGGKYTFDHWSGDSASSVAATSVTMDGPKTVTAEWRTDNTMPYIVLGGIGAAIIVLVLLLLMKRRKAPASSAA